MSPEDNSENFGESYHWKNLYKFENLGKSQLKNGESRTCKDLSDYS